MMTPKRKPTKPRTKVVKAVTVWVLISDYGFLGTYKLFLTRKDAFDYGRIELGDNLRPRTFKPVRVLISIAPSKGKHK